MMNKNSSKFLKISPFKLTDDQRGGNRVYFAVSSSLQTLKHRYIYNIRNSLVYNFTNIDMNNSILLS